jgi:hypothetical protein
VLTAGPVLKASKFIHLIKIRRILKKVIIRNIREVMGGWRKLYNEELHNVYSSSSKIRMMKSRRMRWEGHVVWGKEECMLVGNPEEERPLGRPRRRWVDNVKMNVKRERMGWYGLDRSGPGQGPVEGSCEHGNETSGSIKCWEVLE